MMKRFTIPVLAVFTLLGMSALSCGPKDDHPHVAEGTANQAATQPAAKVDVEKSAKVATIDWCIVSGENLGSMGDPVSYKYKDREMKFCCKNCVKEFESDPITYLARLDSAQAGLILQPGKTMN